jgi:hypothetical protein
MDFFHLTFNVDYFFGPATIIFLYKNFINFVIIKLILSLFVKLKAIKLLEAIRLYHGPKILIKIKPILKLTNKTKHFFFQLIKIKNIHLQKLKRTKPYVVLEISALHLVEVMISRLEIRLINHIHQ